MNKESDGDNHYLTSFRVTHGRNRSDEPDVDEVWSSYLVNKFKTE
jgi:hypothetical protein